MSGINANFILAGILILVAFVGAAMLMGVSTESVGILMALVAPTIIALLALLKTDNIQSEVKTTHEIINSRMDQLLAVTGTSEHAKGMLEQRAVTRRATDYPELDPTRLRKGVADRPLTSGDTVTVERVED